jgi:hypothetical protein
MSSSTWRILIGLSAVSAAPVFAAEGVALKAVSAFSSIEEPHARSMALFVEAATRAVIKRRR